MLIIERIEDGIAVIEDGDGHFEVSAESLGENVREGDIVTCDGGIYQKNEDATEQRRKEIIEMQNSLWE